MIKQNVSSSSVKKAVLIAGLTVASLSAIADAGEMRDAAVRCIQKFRRESSLFFAPNEKEAVRRRIFSDPDAKSWWTDFSRVCSSNLCLGADIPSRGGQWWNYYFCKRCNSLLRTEAADRHVCPKCRHVYSGWPYDDAALLLKHMKLSEAVRDAGLAYEISGDDQQFRFIKSVLLEYAAKYPKYELHDNQGKKSRSGGIVTSQALDDAVWLIGIVSGYDAVAGRLSPQDRSRIEDCVLRPEAAMLMKADAGSRRVGNHECWHAAAVGLVGYVLNDAELIRHAEKSSAGLDYQLKNGVLSDGAWFELAWGYHFYTIQALMPFYRAKRNHGGELPESLHKMFRAPISQVMSGWRLPANGDTGNVAFAPGAHGDLYGEASRWWPDDAELSAWASAVPKKSRGFALWGRKSGCATIPRLESTCSEGSGIAALRIGQLADGSPRTSLAFDFGPHGGWHGHLDKLSYELWHEGRCLADDPGCGNYAQPLHFAWIRQALAHNTISVDGKGQLPCEGKLLAFREEGDHAAVVASAPISEGVVATRALALMDGLVFDLVWTDSESEHAYDWAFHAKGDCSTSCDLAKTSLGEKIVRDRLQPENWDGSEAQTWLEDLRKGAHNGVWAAVWSSEADTVRVRQVSSSGDLHTGLGWGACGRERETVVFNRVKGCRVVFATVVDFASHDVGDIRLERTGGRIGMSVRIGGETRAVWLDESGRRGSFGRRNRSVFNRLLEWFRSRR